MYVDDFILFAKFEDIQEQLLCLLHEHGWIVNLKKSKLEPSLQYQFIVYLIGNSGEQTVIKIPNNLSLSSKRHKKMLE